MPDSTPVAPLADRLDYGSAAEWVAALVAILALAISIAAVVLVRRSEKRSLFIHLHDLLTSPDSQVGRRILHTRMTSERRIDRIFKRRPDDFDQVNRALGLYNTLGIYAHKGYVSKDEALDHWGGRVRKGWPAIERFLRWRRSRSDDSTMWSYLVWFAQESEANVSCDMRLREGWTARIPAEDQLNRSTRTRR
ncbi:DUF4760 domain-containing protein [Microbacterium aquimaris]